MSKTKSLHCIKVLKEALEAGAFPSAAVAIGQGKKLLHCEVMGQKDARHKHHKIHKGTLYDLASLTKLVAPTMIALKLLEEGRLLLTDPLSRYFTPEELKDAPEGRADVTIFQLMTHTSGITPHMPLWTMTADAGSPAADKEIPEADVEAPISEADAPVSEIAETPAETGTVSVKETVSHEQAVYLILSSPAVCAPGEEVHYSCMGYILLGKILERITGKSLDVLAATMVFHPLGMKHTTYRPKSKDVAVTEFSALRGDYIHGEVHDENAHFLGGVSGNAGVFSSINDMVLFATMLAERGKTPNGQFLSDRTFELAVQNYTPGMAEARGLGFQLKPPVPALSPMGDLMTEGSYGHTGFTGTSLYVDAESGRWAVLLTNAVHYGRDKTAFLRYRRLFHNAFMADELT